MKEEEQVLVLIIAAYLLPTFIALKGAGEAAATHALDQATTLVKAAEKRLPAALETLGRD